MFKKDKVKILGVFAQPDDEFTISGLLARAYNQGIETHLICATRGQGCRIRHPEIMNEKNKAEVRTKELEGACNILEVSSLNFLDLEDGKSKD